MALSSGSIEERLAFIITSLTQRGSKNIKLIYKQKDLCCILGVQRSSLMSALDRLSKEGIVDYTLSEISVNSREELFKILHSDEN